MLVTYSEPVLEAGSKFTKLLRQICKFSFTLALKSWDYLYND